MTTHVSLCVNYFLGKSTVHNVIADCMPTVLPGAGSREAAQHVLRAKEQVLSGYGSKGSMASLPQSTTPDSCSKQPQSVRLPDEQPLDPSSKQGGGKQEEAARVLPGETGASSRYDPPPSYSSVVGEVTNTEGACGFTPKLRYSDADSISSYGPIHQAYPAYLNPIPKSGGNPIARATAPEDASVDGSEHQRRISPQRGLARSVSDRRMMNENRSSVHPVLRQHEDKLTRPSSHYAEYSDTPLNEAQMATIRNYKPNKRLSMKSFSVAGSTISEFLGLNTNNNSRAQQGRPFDSDYESYDFSRSRDDIESNGSHVKDFSNIHGVLPEELAHSRRQTSVSTSTAGASNTSKDKSRALSAKFAIPIPVAAECREELSPPIHKVGATGTVSQSAEAATPTDLKNNHPKVKENHLTKTSSDKVSVEGSVNVHRIESSTDNNESVATNLTEVDKSDRITDVNDATKDLIDLNITQEANELDNSPDDLNRESQLDGDLSTLAKPRNSFKTSNPFYECGNSDDSESDNSNSASMTR